MLKPCKSSLSFYLAMAAPDNPFEGLLSFPAYHKHLIEQLREHSQGDLPKNASLRADHGIFFVWSFRKVVPDDEVENRFRVFSVQRARNLSPDYARLFWRQDLNQPLTLQLRKRILNVPADANDPLADTVQSIKLFCFMSAGNFRN